MARVSSSSSGGSAWTYATGPADANQTMAVGTWYDVDISAYTVDRTFTLPSVAAVGDRCAVQLAQGDTAFELLVTAAGGDTLNGVAGGTEWSRIFILGEVLVFRCVTANAAWVVELDGRIPQKALMRLSTDATGETAGTLTLPTDKSGAWTADVDNASITTTATGRITPRRTGTYGVSCSGLSVASVTGGANYGVSLILNGGATSAVQAFDWMAATGIARRNSSNAGIPLTADDYVQLVFISSEGSRGLDSQAANLYRSSFAVVEVLP